ncbi:hypothetical protein D3C77_646860 [compost metagenome]
MAETVLDKAVDPRQSMTAVALAKGVVEEPGEDVLLFVHAAQAVEELLLGLALDDEICAGNK